jgi:two-component system invasion response regulator UvrY
LDVIRILVVDDNATVRHYYRAILEQQIGWEVSGEARTAHEALQRLEESLPDLVLLDFKMPDLNGIELAREIIRQWPALPILMVSVYFSKQLAIAARAAGIRGACAKSDIGSIVKAVDTVLHEQMYFPGEHGQTRTVP